ncbi:MAG: hypothetical protein ACRDH8_09320 [Actinomycetota bacterium]
MFTAPTIFGGRAAKWLWITAIFELVLAAVFLVIGLMVPILRGGFTLTAGILGVVGLGLMVWARSWSKKAAEANRLKTQGVPGQASIMGMRQTGVYLNEQPQIELQLQVQTQMHGPYQVTVREYVPLMLLGTLSSGRPLPVKVDPANPNNLVIEWENAMSMPMGAGIPMGGMRVDQAGQMPVAPPPLPSAQGDEDKKRILATGTPGRARIISSAPTGQMDDRGRPIYSMMLQIEVQGRPPVQGPAMAGIPPERAEQLEPGDEIPIKADPANPTSIAVDWDNA